MRRVLIVASSPRVVEVWEEALPPSEWTVVLAENGRDALSVVADRRPELVVIETVLPDMRGSDLIDRLIGIDTSITCVLIDPSALSQGVADLVIGRLPLRAPGAGNGLGGGATKHRVSRPPVTHDTSLRSSGAPSRFSTRATAMRGSTTPRSRGCWVYHQAICTGSFGNMLSAPSFSSCTTAVPPKHTT